MSVAPGVAAGSQTARVTDFVDRYFTAINQHSFSGYEALLNPTLRADESAQSFHSGYRTTTDSDATITAITNVSPGLVGATITFISHQQPSDSATGTSCTDWDITLYLQTGSGTYLIGPAVPGYRASYQAC